MIDFEGGYSTFAMAEEILVANSWTDDSCAWSTWCMEAFAFGYCAMMLRRFWVFASDSEASLTVNRVVNSEW